MTERAEFTLSLSRSAGRVPPGIWTDPDTGEIQVNDWGGKPCPGCREMTAEGDPITFLEDSWWHARCAKTRLLMVDPDRAWIALATQVARRPSHFKTADIRAVLENVTRIAQRAVDDSLHIIGCPPNH